jgi:hypothetical protein
MAVKIVDLKRHRHKSYPVYSFLLTPFNETQGTVCRDGIGRRIYRQLGGFGIGGDTFLHGPAQ